MALRQDSSLGKYFKGYISATALSALLAVGAVAMLAWQALDATRAHALLMAGAFLLSCVLLTLIERSFRSHFHRPFALSFAAFWATWIAALPFAVIFAVETWTWHPVSLNLAEYSIYQVIEYRRAALPERNGWISEAISVLYSYEALKAWLVVQLRQYPWIGILFSVDSAIFSFLLCRSAVAISNFCETHFFAHDSAA